MNPSPLRLAIDKLALALPYEALEKRHRKTVRENLEDIVKEYGGLPRSPKGKAYRHRATVPVNDECTLLIEARPNRPEWTGYAVRIEWNPNKAGDGGNAKVRQILTTLFGEDASHLIAQLGLVAVDWCIDVPGVSINDVIILINDKQYCSTWGKVFHDGAQLESLMAGSPKSSHQVRCYNKLRELLSALAQRTVSIKMADLEQAMKTIGKLMRIEVSTKHSALHPSCLHEIDNPFDGIRFFSLAQVGEALDTDMGRLFIDSVQLNGMNVALRRIKDENQRRRFKREVARHQVDWWDPQMFAVQVVDAVKQLRIFPASAFIAATAKGGETETNTRPSRTKPSANVVQGTLSKMRRVRALERPASPATPKKKR